MLPISRLMTDDRFFGRQFGGESFAAWRALLSGFYGEELTEKQRETFIDLTHREPPNEALSELWMAIGRRGGKSQAAGLIAVHEAFLSEPQAMLAPGEWATVLIVASDRKQARTVRRYIKGLIEQNEMFEKMVQRETSDGLELKNRVAIEIGTASIRALRGYTVLAVIADEIAFWHADGANPDAEIINSVRPALGTLGGKLIALSSPYARRGMLWNTYRRHFANGDSRVLVAQAPTRIMNPTFPEHLVQEAMDEDPSAARAEYLAEFRTDVETFLSMEVVQAARRQKPMEIPYDRDRRYFAFVDPAGGGQDQFTLCIAHREKDTSVIDLVRGRHGSPADIVGEYSAILKAYGLRSVKGDKYAGSWPKDEFARHGITMSHTDKDRSKLYQELLAAFNSARVEIPPSDKLCRQLLSLERRTGRGHRETIDHPPGGHDDLANAVAGAVVETSLRRAKTTSGIVRGLC